MAISLNFDKTVTSPFHRAFPVRVTISNKLVTRSFSVGSFVPPVRFVQLLYTSQSTGSRFVLIQFRRPHCTSHSAQYKWNIICHYYSSSLSSLSGRLVIYIYTYIINGAHSITQFRPAPRPDLQQQKQQQNKEARRLLQLNPITKFTRSEHNFVNDFRLP